MTHADIDPAEMTLEQLAATWTDADPESCLMPNGTRRTFNYSTRGANAGPSPKYRKSAPEVYGSTVAELLKPTAADRAYWDAHPVTVTPKRQHVTPKRIKATKSAPSGFWMSSLESVELYRKITAQRRVKLADRAADYGLTLTPELLDHWAEPIAPIPDAAPTYIHGQRVAA